MLSFLKKLFLRFKRPTLTKPKKTDKKTPVKSEPEVDWPFIHKLEGFSSRGYVPFANGRPIGRSGVTIGPGIDLGQTRIKALKQMGLSDNLIRKLSAYVGLQKWEAYNFALRNPLTLTPDELRELEEAYRRDKLSDLKSLYPRWKTLDDAQWTVLTSVFWQYGHLPTRTPKFWKYFTEKQWGNLVEELENFGDDFKTRRQKEATYLVENSKEVEKSVMFG